ncbi:HPr family phosphocarrier protein [Bifidobacterium reuteri]|uniref:Phosphocarrier protein HPr n=2 Tax=Bifidobacterium reuteri TaxID=983706 RepID=A0A087CTY2_9BIFI|nr:MULTISPECIES: HPr family phosphocarrier protein [Bifidobacterium]KAA8826674.1 HPr family phosphocarrier protein [Bifidobacterium reuteri]KFI86732.1 phosphocarrier protein HPr [Bifidobacterium reuteri DSM 23975]TPF79615.1 hypothetical protein BW08_08980 [Bifidobacterium sp. UTCIF-24]TPF83385.1 hypothetical protein BW07_10545 [Bifidobacterium sp. UTCIF-36]TPF88329.1 hypothetical protein BW10_09915 [Bifidobacterium sp. UTBIF-56]
MITRTVTVGSAMGLHARPAAMFATAVEQTGLDVVLRHGGEEADAASALDIMALGIAGGETVTIGVDEGETGAGGAGAADATDVAGATAEDIEAKLDELAALLSRDFDAADGV